MDSKRCKVTRQQLQELLDSLGFVATQQRDGSTMYYHAPADSIILLPASRGHRQVRPVDIDSVGRHLVGRGHLDEEVFDAFVASGVMPEHAGR